MFSLTQFHKNIFHIFHLMERTGATFEVVHNGKVYDLSVRLTNKKPKLTRAKRPRATTPIFQAITPGNCDKCNSLMFAGICMNTKCPTNS